VVVPLESRQQLHRAPTSTSIEAVHASNTGSQKFEALAHLHLKALQKSRTKDDKSVATDWKSES
jgi:hypothetical protein